MNSPVCSSAPCHTGLTSPRVNNPNLSPFAHLPVAVPLYKNSARRERQARQVWIQGGRQLCANKHCARLPRQKKTSMWSNHCRKYCTRPYLSVSACTLCNPLPTKSPVLTPIFFRVAGSGVPDAWDPAGSPCSYQQTGGKMHNEREEKKINSEAWISTSFSTPGYFWANHGISLPTRASSWLTVRHSSASANSNCIWLPSRAALIRELSSIPGISSLWPARCRVT